MKHRYISVADFRAPFDPIPFQGLGDPEGDPRWHRPAQPSHWPGRRTYWETAMFRTPYRQRYYQDNSLFGLGADATSLTVQDIQRAVGAAPSGQWDAQTSAAISRKQKQLRLPETGALDAPLLVAVGLLRVDPSMVGSFSAGWRDVRTAFNQIPNWAYIVSGGLLLALGWRSYQRWKKGAPAAQ